VWVSPGETPGRGEEHLAEAARAPDLRPSPAKRRANQERQRGKKAPARERPFSAENLDIGNAVLALAWGITGTLLKVPQELVVGGMGSLGVLNIVQTVKAKWESRQERRHEGEEP
jgi:hypothetical protein